MQIVKIDKEWAVLREAPTFILESLAEENMLFGKDHIKHPTPELITTLQKFTSLVVTELPKQKKEKLKKERKRKTYPIPSKLMSLIDKVNYLFLTPKEKECFKDLQENIIKTGGLSRKQFHCLWSLAYMPLYIREDVIAELKHDERLTKAERRSLDNLHGFFLYQLQQKVMKRGYTMEWSESFGEKEVKPSRSWPEILESINRMEAQLHAKNNR